MPGFSLGSFNPNNYTPAIDPNTSLFGTLGDPVSLGGSVNIPGIGSMPGMSSGYTPSVIDAKTNGVPLKGVFGQGGSGFGFNLGTAQLGLTGLQTIGNLWAAFQAQKLAKQQFNYTKAVTDTNLNNSIKTYNTQLTDRANNRAIVEGKDPTQTQAYITANSLRRYG